VGGAFDPTVVASLTIPITENVADLERMQTDAHAVKPVPVADPLAAQGETDAGDRRELTLWGSARAAYGWLSHPQ